MIVKFNHNSIPYHTGDVASFTAEEAAKLVKQGHSIVPDAAPRVPVTKTLRNTDLTNLTEK